MTRDFTPPPPTKDEIERICRETVGSAPSEITPLRSGAWSNAFGLNTPAGPMVLRFSRTADDFRADELASHYASSYLPIPRVFGIGQIDERFWCLSERMPGVHLDELNADQLVEVIPSLAAMLREMRAVDSSHTSGFGGWDDDGNGTFATFADQLLDVASDDTPDQRGGGWSERLQPHRHAQRIFDDGMSVLRDLVNYIPPVRQLIHQDTINYNVTVSDGRISGIFDWGCAMWGDALYDIAWFRFWNPWYPQWSAVDLPAQLEKRVGIEGANAAERMQCYLLHIGLMHIRYNALIENWTAMNEVATETETLLRVPNV